MSLLRIKKDIRKYWKVNALYLCFLLPEKIFERILYDNMLEFFTKNNLISHNQSGFKPGDLYFNQFLSITHKIHKLFDDGREIHGVFLDTFKALDKVWHNGLIYKLKQSGISSNLLDTVTDFLNSRKQRVALNGKLSSCTSIEAGIPEGLILGPLLFLIYIHDLSDDLMTNVQLFLDVTYFFSVIHDVNTSQDNLNNDLSTIIDWEHIGKWVLILIQVKKLKKLYFPENNRI